MWDSWSCVGLLAPKGSVAGFCDLIQCCETEAQQKFKCECNAEVKEECAPDYSWAGLVWWPQMLQLCAQSAGRGVRVLHLGFGSWKSFPCPREDGQGTATPQLPGQLLTGVAGSAALVFMGGANCRYPLDSNIPAVRPARKLTTDSAFTAVTAACVNLCLIFFVKKMFFPETSEHLRIQKCWGFWVNWVWLVSGAELSNCFWWFGFKIHFMLKSPNILLLSLLLSQYYRILYFCWKMKKVCLPITGRVGWFLFLGSHWHCIQSDFMNGEVFLLGNKFLSKRGSFKKHVPGALNIVWRRTADLKEFPQTIFGVCASVDDFTRWGREMYRKQFPYCFWFVACFLLGKQCWCL